MAVVTGVLSMIVGARESEGERQRCHWVSSSFLPLRSAALLFNFKHKERPLVSLCAAGTPSPATFTASARLFISGLSFRTSEESLRNVFEQFGQLTEFNLVMDKIANRPRGFAFIRYATEEEARKAIDGMHGKFLHGRVIFVEVAKPRTQPPTPHKNR